MTIEVTTNNSIFNNVLLYVCQMSIFNINARIVDINNIYFASITIVDLGRLILNRSITIFGIIIINNKILFNKNSTATSSFFIDIISVISVNVISR